MKMRTNFGILLLGFIGFSALIIYDTQLVRNPHQIDNMSIHQEPNEILRMMDKISSYTDSVPIVISSNNGFTNNGFSGNGSSNAPYIIENLHISNSSSFLIDIKDTDAYFIIQNNLLNGQNGTWSPIYLRNVAHGIIRSNIILGGNTGVMVDYSSSNNIILNNDISNGSGVGIYIHHLSHHHEVLRNYVHDCSSGIYISASSYNNTIAGNCVHDNLENGIYTGGRAGEAGYPSNNTFANNTIFNNKGHGIRFDQCDECLFYNNTIEKNGGYAIRGGGTGNKFIENMMKNNQNGMEVVLQSSNISGNIITNTLDATEPSMYLGGEGGNIFMNNIVFNNSGLALKVKASVYQYASNVIMRNDFIANPLTKDSQALDITLSDQIYTGEIPSFSYNYWYDWMYPDNNSDGIVDFPYPIPTFEGETNFDNFPLTTPCNPYSSSLHFLSCPRIIRPVINDILDGNIYVEWHQATDISSSLIHYTIYYSFNGSQWIEIQDNLIEPQFIWDAGNLTNGEYKLRVVADCPESGLTSEYNMHEAFFIKSPELTSGFDLLFILLSLPTLAVFWKKKKNIM